MIYLLCFFLGAMFGWILLSILIVGSWADDDLSIAVRREEERETDV